MEEMMKGTIAAHISYALIQKGRRAIGPDCVVKVPDNHIEKKQDINIHGISEYQILNAVYVARSDDLIVIAKVWSDGTMNLYFM